MSLYTKTSVERVKDAVDMVELVGSKTDLRRVGARWTGLCPFHDERTPSFSVNAEHRLYHCFGCGASGDAISFVREQEGLDFREAIEALADRYGVELEREEEDPQEEQRRRRRDRLVRLLDRTAEFYARFLWESAEARPAREYLLGRGLTEETLKAFRVGYAPSAWHRVLDAGQRDGYSIEEMVAAGVVQHGRQGGAHDRFRSRITFPLADARGRVLGFGARATREGQRPKYLNSSENELFRKGKLLFAIDKARGPAARAGRVIAVEGYTDVLALHQAGTEETVAVMGTALTDDQLRELSRAATTVYLALDADRAGQEAMLRASRGAAERGMELLVVALPEGTDPAELVVRDGAEAFERLLNGALTVPEFEARRVIAAADLSTPRGRDHALERLRPLIAEVPERTATRDELVRWAADRLDIPVDYLTIQLAAPPARSPAAAAARSAAPAPAAAAVGAGPAPAPAGGPSGPVAAGGEPQAGADPGAAAARAVLSGPRARAERAFLAMCVGHPSLGRELLERVGGEHLATAPLRAVRDHLAAHLDDPLADLPPDPAEAALVTEVAMLAAAEPSSETALRVSFQQLELWRIQRLLREAQQAGDFDSQRSLVRTREQVRSEIARLMGEDV